MAFGQSTIGSAIAAKFYNKNKKNDSTSHKQTNAVSTFLRRQLKVAYFAITTARHKQVGSGNGAILGTDENRIEIKRVGSWLLHMAIVLEFNGIVAYSASAPETIDTTGGWLDVVDYQPYFVNMLGLAAVSNVNLEVSSNNLMKITNDAMLDLAELLGTPGRRISEYVGEYGPVDKQDMAKDQQVFIIPLPTFFSEEAPIASTVVMLHGMAVVVSLADSSKLMKYPTTATQADAGTGTSTTLLYGTDSGQFQVYIRPIGTSNEGLNVQFLDWGSEVPTKLADNDTLVRSLYVASEHAFSSDLEHTYQAKSHWSQFLPCIRTIEKTVSGTNAANTKFTLDNLALKREVECLFVHVRPDGNDFADIYSKILDESLTRKRNALLQFMLTVDETVAFDMAASEARLQQLWHASTNTDMNIVMCSFALKVGQFNVRGTRNWKRATDIKAEVLLDRFCFGSTLSKASIFITMMFRIRVDHVNGRLMVKM